MSILELIQKDFTGYNRQMKDLELSAKIDTASIEVRREIFQIILIYNNFSLVKEYYPKASKDIWSYVLDKLARERKQDLPYEGKITGKITGVSFRMLNLPEDLLCILEVWIISRISK